MPEPQGLNFRTTSTGAPQPPSSSSSSNSPPQIRTTTRPATMAPSMSLFAVKRHHNPKLRRRIAARRIQEQDHIQRLQPHPTQTSNRKRHSKKGLLEKTAKQTSDIILYDNRIVLYKSESDVMMYVVGGVEENEIMLYNVTKRTIIENYDLVALAIDEIVDDGIILETDPTIIVQRVSRAPTQDAAQLKGIDLSEQGMNNLAQFGKAKLGD
ncbi:putative coatomer subunit zeta, partial [Lachnellula subtilissima]